MTMNTSRASLMRSLRDHANRFDAESNARKRACPNFCVNGSDFS